VRHAGLTWSLPDGLDDNSLELLLFRAPSTVPDAERLVPDAERLVPDAERLVPDAERLVPDWSVIDRELRRPGVTRMLLWEECRAAHPAGFAYTWFCTHYEAWKGRVRPTSHLWCARRRTCGAPDVAPVVRFQRNAPDTCGRGESVRRLCRRYDRRD
jgi:transposase